MIDSNLIISPHDILGYRTSSFMTTKLLEEEFSELKEVNNGEIVNKDFLQNLINIPVVWMNQEHGNVALEVFKRDIKKTVNADALYSKESGLAIAVVSADCLPVILSDKNSSEIAAIHAGWRGLADGIIESTLELFMGKLDNISAWLAPCISLSNFEVGQDVFSRFEARGLAQFCIYEPLKNKWYLDLQGAAREVLERYGLTVQASNSCTFNQNHLFHSYRKNKTLNRMVTLIWKD